MNTWKILQGLHTVKMKDTWGMTKKLLNINPKIPPVNHSGKILMTIQEKVYVFAAVERMEIADLT